MDDMLDTPDVPADVTWRKSGRSGKLGNCVELASFPGAVAVRNSRFPDGTTLVFPAADMSAFVAAVKDGDFDDMAVE